MFGVVALCRILHICVCFQLNGDGISIVVCLFISYLFICLFVS